MNARAIAVRILMQVITQGHSLTNLFPSYLEQMKLTGEKAFVQELCYGVCRWYYRLAAIADLLMTKPLKSKDQDVYILLLLGLYQLIYMRKPPHVCVSETVAATNTLNKSWAKGLVNAVLREFQRNSDTLQNKADKEEAAKYAHPAWLITAIKESWPEQWQAILQANNQHPPMCLRINARKVDRKTYLSRLESVELKASELPFVPHGILMEKPVEVERLPGFAEGWVSVQDGAAQMAISLLDAKPGEVVLDACAAPGGKTCHILETQPELKELVALDIDEDRLRRIAENLQRLQLSARLIAGDAAEPETWWNGNPFDRILLDAPCSATGVIRRHSDIKILRRYQDVQALAQLQFNILTSLWPLLKSGGRLLYVTCSILEQENERQIARFLDQQDDAHVIPIEAQWGHSLALGRQILPGELGMDGFYYACLRKG